MALHIRWLRPSWPSGRLPNPADECTHDFSATSFCVTKMLLSQHVPQSCDAQFAKQRTMHLCCRVCCQLLRPDLERVLAQQPPARGPLLDLLHAVHQLEKKAQKHFPAALGEHPQLYYCRGESAHAD